MKRVFINLIVITALLTSCMQKSLITPKELLCETKTNPSGIATTMPHFNWKNDSKVNKSHQTAYQILVATSEARLQDNNADLWNSGKVQSSNSVLIPYTGRALESRSVAYWKIKVWGWVAGSGG